MHLVQHYILFHVFSLFIVDGASSQLSGMKVSEPAQKGGWAIDFEVGATKGENTRKELDHMKDAVCFCARFVFCIYCIYYHLYLCVQFFEVVSGYQSIYVQHRLTALSSK